MYINNLQDQCTPLYIASGRGFNEIVKSLIAANANVNCICKVSCYCLVSYVYVATWQFIQFEFGSLMISCLISLRLYFDNNNYYYPNTFSE